MAITNHTNPTTATGMAYFSHATTITVGTTTTQKKPAAAIGGNANAMPRMVPNWACMVAS